MVETPPPSPAETPKEPMVDAVSAAPVKSPASVAARSVSPADLSKAKRKLLALGGFFYTVYLLWCAALMVLLPSTSQELQMLVSVGLITSLAGGAIFILGGLFALLRISKADVSISQRQRSLIKTLIVIVPGLILSSLVPYLITREPPLTIAITYPTASEDFVAPLAVTLSAEPAVQVLAQRGQRAIKYQWDFDGDGEMNEETALPTATALYEKQGVYPLAVRIFMEDGTSRKVSRRITIPRAVFSVSPYRPVIEQPVQFSIRHLVSDPKEIRQVEWDFDEDGEADETVTTPDIIHTFYSTGRRVISATVQLTNQTQGTYERAIDIEEAEPLPFPVTLITEPKNLVGPAPFGAIFRIETTEPIREVSWTFGDGKPEERGADLRRVAHSFEEPGNYSVVAKIRSASGSQAEITTLVRATENLNLPDLTFSGEPTVNRNAITGEVPLRIQLTPKTTVPLVSFMWEAPDATTVNATGATLEAIYRRSGSYTITLLAQDPEGKALRLPITITVTEPSIEPSIQMKPEGGAAPITISFDASDTFVPPGEQIAGFTWLFGDEPRGQDEPETGTAQMKHTYTQAGEYTVVLTVIMESGKEFKAERSVIIRRPSLAPCFTPSRLVLAAGGGVEFDSSCTSGNPTSFLWDVRLSGNSQTVLGQSSDRTYVHVFEEPGIYTVTLTTGDQFGNTESDSITITVTSP